MRERESLFNEWLLEVRKREKEEKTAKREQVRINFTSGSRDLRFFLKFSKKSFEQLKKKKKKKITANKHLIDAN